MTSAVCIVFIATLFKACQSMQADRGQFRHISDATEASHEHGRHYHSGGKKKTCRCCCRHACILSERSSWHLVITCGIHWDCDHMVSKSHMWEVTYDKQMWYLCVKVRKLHHYLNNPFMFFLHLYIAQGCSGFNKHFK